MADYRAPVDEIWFVLTHTSDLLKLLTLENYAHVDLSSTRAVIEECGRFMAEVVAPLNVVGDQVGARLEPDGTVRTPPGFAEAYRRYVDAGWGAVPFAPEHGGGGFPWAVAVAMQEMLTSANMAFSLCPLLTQGAIDALSHHASPELQAAFLPKMVTGEWSGTMNLTEPHAGSDVGALSSKAVPSGNGDGTWRITGQKIFITYGEQDLTEQIVHLVLARTPGAPAGTKGISCFVVPKFLLNADGTLGARNDVRCISIERKLGIHASPTCVMSYGDDGGAVGYLLGEEHSGMRTMFTMMNNARLSVGIEGVALAERAYQQAVAYARERRQGRAPGTSGMTTEPSRIIEHPDVRRMLLTMRAGIEAMRALAYRNAAEVDRAKATVDPAARAAAKERLDLLTPITKGWCTDMGVELTSLAVQVHGGMGYVEETGVAQFLRDARIAPIYEGTNGIQAIDLVTRKLPMRNGAVMAELLDELRSVGRACEHTGADKTVRSLGAPLLAALDAVAESSAWLTERLRQGRLDDVLTGATPYLRLCGTVIGGGLLVEQALAAVSDDGSAEAGFAERKAAVAGFYVANLLPVAHGLGPAIATGAETLYALAETSL